MQLVDRGLTGKWLAFQLLCKEALSVHAHSLDDYICPSQPPADRRALRHWLPATLRLFGQVHQLLKIGRKAGNLGNPRALVCQRGNRDAPSLALVTEAICYPNANILE